MSIWLSQFLMPEDKNLMRLMVTKMSTLLLALSSTLREILVNKVSLKRPMDSFQTTIWFYLSLIEDVMILIFLTALILRLNLPALFTSLLETLVSRELMPKFTA